MTKKKKNREPDHPKKFRLSETEYFYLVRLMFTPDFGLVLSPTVDCEFRRAWSDPENYKFRDTSDQQFPVIGLLVERMPI